MARFTGGWVKFWRKAALGDINSNFTRGGLFGALISMANLKESTVDWGGKPRTLTRGELVTSLQELADIGESDRRTIDRHLNYLRLRGTISYEKRPFGTFIKVLNFEQYQSVDAQHAKPERNEWYNHSAHIEEIKKERKDITDADFEILAKKYKGFFPTTGLGPAKKRFFAQITSREKLNQLSDSIDHYRTTLDVEKWKKPKQTFATYLGTETSGFYWLDYINGPLVEATVSTIGGMLEV